jgi:hypothetical protein
MRFILRRVSRRVKKPPIAVFSRGSKPLIPLDTHLAFEVACEKLYGKGLRPAYSLTCAASADQDDQA